MADRTLGTPIAETSNRRMKMKKAVMTLICVVALAVAAIPVGAQTRSRCSNTRAGYDQRYDHRSDNRYDNEVYGNDSYRDDVYRNEQYRNDDYRYNRGRTIWDKHRDKITTAGGAVAGAVLGGLIGGKKGALLGAMAGGGGAAVYTYKIRNRYPRY